MAEKKSKLVEIKTKPTSVNPEEIINRIASEQKRNDSFSVMEMMKQATGEQPVVWGGSLIGFGNVLFRSPKTGREVEWFRIGFAPRQANMALYLTMDVKQFSADLDRLGKHKTGMGCLYINKLDDVDVSVLKEIISKAAKINK